jgi:hypothetical protein
MPRARVLTALALALAAASVTCGPMAWAKPAAHRPLPARASGLPTPKQAFALVHYKFDDADWHERTHGERVVPMRNGFALLMRGAPEGCPGCTGFLSVAYFYRRHGRWSAARTWGDIFEGGSWGGNFWIEFSELGLANPTLELAWRTGQGGWDEAYTSILELTPLRPILRADHVLAVRDNSGATGDPEQSCNVDSSVRPLKGRPGIAVRYWGHIEHRKRVAGYVRYFGRGDRWTAHPRAFILTCSGS